MVVGKTEIGIKRAIERCSLALALALALRIGKRHSGSNKDCVCHHSSLSKGERECEIA